MPRPRSCRVDRRIVIALLAVGALACKRTAEPVRIGVVLPPRNAAAAYIAADEINAAGGIRGRPLIVVVDTVADAAEPAHLEIRRAQSMVARGDIVGVIGHSGSRGSLAAAPVYAAAGVVQIVPTGTSRLLAAAGPWTFVLPPNDSVEGVFIAEFVRDRLRARSVVIFYINDEYGIGLRDGVRSALAVGGVRLLREVRYDLGSDLGVLVDAAVRDEVPDVVVVAGRTGQTAAIARRLRSSRLRCRIVAGDGSYALPDLVTLSGPAAEGIHVVTFWLPGGTSDLASQRLARTVRLRLLREAGSPDAMVYDAVRLLAAAVGAVGDDPAAVRRYLLELGSTRPHFRGLTGEIEFGAGARSPRFTMGVLRGDRLVPVEPPFR